MVAAAATANLPGLPVCTEGGEECYSLSSSLSSHQQNTRMANTLAMGKRPPSTLLIRVNVTHPICMHAVD